MANLYIVSTPIGNIKDITLRSLDILREVDLILCEDTRITQKLLNFYQIKKPAISYHQHSGFKKISLILNFLKEGKNLALVSDAGTPGISDPGNLLIDIIIKKIGDKVKIIPIPGPSALTAAISISGIPMDRFLFLGFLPRKKKRKKFFIQIIESDFPVIFYESAPRIIKSLQEIERIIFLSKKKIAGELKLVICRELTKKFESVYRGSIKQIIEQLKGESLKGEFVVILSK